MSHDLMFMLIVVVTTGILAQIISGIVRIPSIVFLLSFGVLLGPSFWELVTGTQGGFIRPRMLGEMLPVLVELSVVLILFEGSMTLRIGELKRVLRSVRSLCTIGMIITCSFAAAAAVWIAGLELRHALIFGSLVSVTGPTVIKPLMARIKVRREIKTILEGEGILADPIGALMAIVALQFALGEGRDILGLLQSFGVRILLGAIVGAALGLLLAAVVRFRVTYSDRLKNLIALVFVYAAFAVSERIIESSGLTAVVVAGLFAQAGIGHAEHELRLFKEQLSILVLSVLFVLLAANLDLRKMIDEGWPGIATILVLMFVVRPVNIFLTTWGGRPTFREKLFLSWTAPRGIVAASVASLSAIVLLEHGQAGGSRVESLVFLAIFMTVFVQASLARPIAWLLGISKGAVGPVLIIGANSIGIALANLLSRLRREVIVIDKNAGACRAAQKLGLNAVHGDALDREFMLKTGLISEAESLLAMTQNLEVNHLIGQMARLEYEVEHVHIADPNPGGGQSSNSFARMGAGLAFGRALALQKWDDRIRAGETELIEIDLAGSTLAGLTPGELPHKEEMIALAHAEPIGIHIVDHRRKLPSQGRLFLLVRKEKVDEISASLIRRPAGASTS